MHSRHERVLGLGEQRRVAFGDRGRRDDRLAGWSAASAGSRSNAPPVSAAT
jgi:hypothetical protein